ncbi:MAG: NAD-dependent epimerase/dehydratase family protein [Chloroflexota bacterium]
MKLLILGGTVFLGRHTVEVALARGHEVTLFNRGQRDPELFPDVEKLLGDRNGDLSALRWRKWDAVVDTCGYVPRIVRASAELLAQAVERYVFISSISVYHELDKAPGLDEDSPVGKLEDETVEEITGETYGPLKALCEQAAEQALPGRALNIRPGLIVGPHDPTDRFTYWPVRVAQGGGVLAPDGPNWHTQVIDVRDLAEWTIRMVEAKTTGVFNATGPDYPLTFGKVLDECKAVSGSDARFVWVDGKFLLDAGVQPWSELPLWLGGGDMTVSVNKAIAAGLTFRPLADTIRDTLAWDATRPSDREPRAGMKKEREEELLSQWKGVG